MCYKCLALSLALLAKGLVSSCSWAEAPAVPTVPGVQARIAVFEVLTADTTETALIDSSAADLVFDRETTLRAGNFVLHLTVSRADAERVRMSYELFVSGPLPDNRSDDVIVEYDAPLVIESVRGKGKSAYRALVFPHRAMVQPSASLPVSDTMAREILPTPYYYFYLTPGEIPRLHFLPLRDALSAEFEHLRDTLAFTAPGRVYFYLVESPTDDIPLDPRFGFAVDPARNRAVALYDPRASGVDVAAMLLVNLYRWWGYAPELLAVGLAGYNSFADHDVLADRARRRSIPLDSVVRTLDFKRCDPHVASHKAASFVHWLAQTYGWPSLRDLYSRSTDLSLRRAVWAVYGKTLGELEQEWLAYLKNRKFTREELVYFAERARCYRRYEEYLSLLQEAAKTGDSVDVRLIAKIGVVQAHLGRWQDAAATFGDLVRAHPDTATYRWLFAEALQAAGDHAGTVRELVALQRLAPDDPRPYMRLADMQYEQRRRDSAAVLWQRGLDIAKGNRLTIELLLRLARYEAGQRGGNDSAAQLFDRVRWMADEAIGVDPGGPDGWIFGGEALLGLDSLHAAIAYFQTAQYLADAPVDLGRIHLDLGACYDRAGRRVDAITEYERVLAIPATAPDRRWARYYINNVYRY